MYAKRNSILIAILWALIMIIGALWYTRETRRLKDFELNSKELKKQLAGCIEVVQALNAVETKYQDLKERWDYSPKRIISSNEPSFSLYYLNWLTTNYDVNVDFDFVLNNMTDDGDIISFNFSLAGEGTYHDIFRLILFLTKNPLLYQLESFSISQKKEEDDLLNFNFQIRGFSLSKKWGRENDFSFDSLKPVSEENLFHESFKPVAYITKPKPTISMFDQEKAPKPPKPVDENLLNVEQCSLEALANGQVYLRDSKGKLVTLKAGEKVRFGSLQNINQIKSEAEFIINRDGKTQQIILGLGYKK